MKKVFIFLSIFLLSIAACTEKSETIDMEIPSANLSVEEKNDLIRSYAQILSSAVSDPEIRLVIKKEVAKQFDGDYDVLLSSFHAVEMKNNVTVAQKLNNCAIATKSACFSEEVLEHIRAQFPNLQVSVPVHLDDWDPATYIPMVAFLPIDYDESSFTEIEAYDSEGNINMLSLDVEPDVPVIVIGISERVDLDGNIKGNFTHLSYIQETLETKSTMTVSADGLQLFNGSSGCLDLHWTDVTDNTGYQIYRKSSLESNYSLIAETTAHTNYYIDSGLIAGVKYRYMIRTMNGQEISGYSAPISTYASNRNDGEELIVKRVKFTTEALKKVEKWASGAPEIRLRVVVGNVTGAIAVFTSSVLEPRRRADVNNSWWNCNVPIVSWYQDRIGTVLNFDWREEDWDDSCDFTINGSYESKLEDSAIKVGGSLTYSSDPGKDVIGNKLVFWWDNKSTTYDNSSVIL